MVKSVEALTNRTIAETLRKANGSVTKAAKRLGLKRTTLHMRIAKKPKLQAILHEARQTMVDRVESVFFANCLDKSPQYVTARIFFLKCQAKDRGYVERSEVELSGPGGGPVITEIIIEHQAVQTIRTDAEYIDDLPTDTPQAIADTSAPAKELDSAPTTDPSAPSIS